MSFDTWLREQLARHRISQRVLARKSGVNHSTISRLLNGQRSPTLTTVSRLADALDVPMPWR